MEEASEGAEVGSSDVASEIVQVQQPEATAGCQGSEVGDAGI